MHPDLLVITRNFPPQRGGLEVYSYHLTRELARHMQVRVIALKKPKVHLVWFLPAAFLLSLFLIHMRGIRRVHICDAALSPIGFMLKRLSGARVTASAHGLDITFPNPIYQRVVPSSLARLDAILCVSQATREECLSRGIARQRCRVIPNGVEAGDVFHPTTIGEMLGDLSAVFGHRPSG